MKAEEARRKLIDESVRLIEENGLAGLSFREMARRAGLSHQAPYHYFKSREGILAAIAHEGFAQLDARLVESGSERHQSPDDALSDLMRTYMRFGIDHPVHYRIMFRPELVPLPRYPEALATAQSAFQRLVDTVAACSVGMPTTDPRLVEIANSLWSAVHGVVTLWLDGPMKPNTPGQSVASLIDTTAAMFGAAGATAARALKKTATDSRPPKPPRRGSRSARGAGNRRSAG